MSVVRTYYWDPRPSRLPRAVQRWRGRPTFIVGNAGDLFNRDLISWSYPEVRAENTDVGRRLLLVGSIAHQAGPGDLVNGVGCKFSDMPAAPVTGAPRLRGLRGPMSLEALRRSGHNVSAVEFLGDPGLLIGRVFPEALEIQAEPGREIFIPHFRERSQFDRVVRHAEVVDIDAEPRDVALAIAGAEVVHTSSLHGLIWAHALGRAASLIAPRTAESEFKYRDYFASTGTPFHWHDDVEASLVARNAKLVDVSRMVGDITMPTWQSLLDAGVADLA